MEQFQASPGRPSPPWIWILISLIRDMGNTNKVLTMASPSEQTGQCTLNCVVWSADGHSSSESPKRQRLERLPKRGHPCLYDLWR